MIRREVISSTVKSIGYESGILEVEYKDGTVYACSATEPEVLALMFAKSLGAHLHQNFRAHLVRVLMDEKPIPPPAVAIGMDIVVPDRCCQGPLQKAIRSGAIAGLDWVCPRCGAGWICKVEGDVRYWSPDDVLELIKLR